MVVNPPFVSFFLVCHCFSREMHPPFRVGLPSKKRTRHFTAFWGMLQPDIAVKRGFCAGERRELMTFALRLRGINVFCSAPAPN
jgi:hypothetical protein